MKTKNIFMITHIKQTLENKKNTLFWRMFFKTIDFVLTHSRNSFGKKNTNIKTFKITELHLILT